MWLCAYSEMYGGARWCVCCDVILLIKANLDYVALYMGWYCGVIWQWHLLCVWHEYVWIVGTLCTCV